MSENLVPVVGILQSKDTQSLEVWLDDAQQSGIYAVQRRWCSDQEFDAPRSLTGLTMSA